MSVRIRYSCPHCERRIEHNAALAGQLVICSACKGEFYEPTDPLPGKPAEKALKPKPEEKRTVRVPVGMPGIDNQLAVLSPQGSSGMQTIEQIVEAVLIGDTATKPAASKASTAPAPFSAPLNTKSSAPLAQPASRSASTPMLPSPTMRPQLSQPPSPTANQPVFKAPIPVEGLAGVSAKQMIDELRRRGLFAVLLTAEAGSPTQVHVVHSENMTDDDAISMLKRHVASLSSGDEKKPAKTGLLGRMFGGDEG